VGDRTANSDRNNSTDRGGSIESFKI
jgi:hypothetical protein